MPVIAVIGAQWGDEGKGKIVDLLAEKANIVARFGGGSNAGHTVVNPQGTFKLRLIPSGIFHTKATCVLGNGLAIDLTAFFEELAMLKESDIHPSNLYISDKAHVIMPYHYILDGLEEEAKGANAIGTTRRGIGPMYVDKVSRLGIRVGDLLDKDVLRSRLEPVLKLKNDIITKVYGDKPLSFDEVYKQYCDFGQRIAPFVREVDSMVIDALDAGELVMLEGAQGALLDIDHGTYPFVTSSSPMIGGACTGLGLSPLRIDHILGIFKAYTTRVGAGPMPTESHEEPGNTLRERGNEYGTNTKRPRRCGWFDAVISRYSAQINGFNHAALTRLDILDTFESIKICTAYKVGDVTYTRPPSLPGLLEKCEPVYIEMPGWNCDITNIKRYEDLPAEAKAYAKKIEELLGCPINLISVGSAREQTIEVSPIL
ncbi:MAG: adenylosuccinate synthase [Chloroflexi bacterium]|jgi:adenylosuccinate synthase|nr:adenylosuccinate synthase [Chloroflexota bacterium]MBT7079915.1 adenylosuccinate synthase [Chloroflexota bacterium]MBT7288865.1 adenylosuccinate synthase [Chloroflexota bacterium]